MSDYTPNIGLALTPEETNETFKVWRTKLNGEQNSNMTIIDEKIGEISQNIDELDNNKIDISGGDISNTVVSFTEATTRANISTNEKAATMFGKIKKWFSDLKTVAFSGAYSDLTGTPTIDTSLSTNSSNLVQNKVVANAINAKAPTAHASTDTTYGTGTLTKYGHVKLSDSTNTTSGEDDGIAATPTAVKTVYELVSGKLEDSDFYYNDGESVDIAGVSELLTTVGDNIYKKNASTIVIGHIDSRSNNVYLELDYVADDADCSTLFQSAINALPSSGGKIVIREGNYLISKPITIGKNVIFEGMGSSTSLDISGTIIAGRNTSFENCELTFNFEDNSTSPIINGNTTQRLLFDKCNVSVSTSSQRNFVGGGQAVLLNSTLTFTLNSFVKCSNVFSGCPRVKIDNCDITLINNGNSNTSASHNCNVNLIYDDAANLGTHTYATISNCNIKCSGKLSENGKYSMACISHSPHTVIVNCPNITLNDYGSISQGVDVIDASYLSSVVNCSIYSTSTVTLYIGCERFVNNYLSKASDTILYFAPAAIISNNYFENNKANDIEIYNNGTTVFTNNRVGYSCKLTENSSASTVIANNAMGVLG